MSFWNKLKHWLMFDEGAPTLVEQIQDMVEQEKAEEIKPKRKPRKKKNEA